MTRTGDAAITENDRFAAAWPRVADRLRPVLRCRGLDDAAAEDVLQEVALRALVARVPFEDADDLYPWARVVGLRLVIDQHRRRASLADGAVPDRAEAAAGPARVVETRLMLDAVAATLPTMTKPERDAILDGLSGERHGSRADANRIAVRRHRARLRLAAMVGHAGAAIAAVLGRLRRRAAALTAAATPALVLVVAIALAIGAADAPSAGSPGTPTGNAAVPDHESRGAHEPGHVPSVTVQPSPARGRAARSPGRLPRLPLTTTVTVQGPDGGPHGARIREGSGDEPPLCIKDWPVIGTACIGWPWPR